MHTADAPDPPALQDGQRKLTTILSADVAGYSRLMAEDEDATVSTLRGHHAVFEALVALHRGRIFNTAGDAIMAEFASPLAAVRCASEIQALLTARNDQLPPSRRVVFRIGINVGDVVVRGSDLLGDGVNVAARLQASAPPGGIWVSGSVREQISNKLKLEVEPLGEQTFKNIPEPVQAFAIQAEARTPHRRATVAPWVAAAASVLLTLGAGYWGYTQHKQATAARFAVDDERAAVDDARRASTLANAARQEAEQQLAVADAARREAERRLAQVASDKTAADAARQAAEQRLARAASDKTAADAARATADAASRQQQPVVRTPPASPTETAAASTPKPAPAAAKEVYGGMVCYGIGGSGHLQAGCVQGRVTVSGGKIAGRFPGTESDTNIVAAGEVDSAGAVTIELRVEGQRNGDTAAVSLTGTMQDGKLNARGTARAINRSVWLNWERLGS
jgi:class 3 adenylate cyclase